MRGLHLNMYPSVCLLTSHMQTWLLESVVFIMSKDSWYIQNILIRRLLHGSKIHMSIQCPLTEALQLTERSCLIACTTRICTCSEGSML
jgi:hypothetical protein